MAVLAYQKPTQQAEGQGLAGLLLERFQGLRNARTLVEEIWRECYDYSFPMRGLGLVTKGAQPGPELNIGYGRSQQADLLDGTATDSCKVLAAALVGGLTPANSRWFGLEVSKATDQDRRWLDEVADLLWRNIHRSNYDAQAYETVLDVVVAGIAALYVDEAKKGGLLFDTWPLSQCYFGTSTPGGMIDICFREAEFTVVQAFEEYGAENLPEGLRKKREKSPFEKVRFLHAIYPRDGAVGRRATQLAFASCHIELESRKIVRESGYHEFPVIVPRWMQIPGSAFAFGPMLEALPDAKTLNELDFFILANADMQTAGMWGAVDDGVLNTRSIRVGPRKVIVMRDKESFFGITPPGKILEAQQLKADKQTAVRRVLMTEQLQVAPDRPQMTLGEFVGRVEILRQMLGPIYGRLQVEYLQPLVERCFGLAWRAGVFPPPPESLAGRAFKVTYLSPLARAQKLQDVAAMDRYEASLGAQAQVGMVDAFDVYLWDEARKRRAELLGVPLDLLPDEGMIDEVREARAATQAKQAQAQVMQEAGMAMLKKGNPSGQLG